MCFAFQPREPRYGVPDAAALGRVQRVLDGAHRYRRPRPDTTVTARTQLPDERGPRVREDYRVRGKSGKLGTMRWRDTWPFAGWQDDDDKARELASWMRRRPEKFTPMTATVAVLARLVEMTPGHRRLLASQQIEEFARLTPLGAPGTSPDVPRSKEAIERSKAKHDARRAAARVRVTPEHKALLKALVKADKTTEADMVKGWIEAEYRRRGGEWAKKLDAALERKERETHKRRVQANLARYRES